MIKVIKKDEKVKKVLVMTMPKVSLETRLMSWVAESRKNIQVAKFEEQVKFYGTK